MFLGQQSIKNDENSNKIPIYGLKAETNYFLHLLAGSSENDLKQGFDAKP